MEKKELADLLSSFKESPAEEILRFSSRLPGEDRLASSFSGEDQVVTDLIPEIDANARIFTIDTGRLPEETYAVMTETMEHYGRGFEVYFRRPPRWRRWKAAWGRTFSIEAWKTGGVAARCGRLHRSPGPWDAGSLDNWPPQGAGRYQAGIQKVEWDETNNLLKLNPLADWTEEQVWRYIRTHQLPYNKLHDRGYPSIGCAPCTRAVKPVKISAPGAGGGRRRNIRNAGSITGRGKAAGAANWCRAAAGGGPGNRRQR